MLGEAEGSGDEVFELSCNVDDMTGGSHRLCYGPSAGGRRPGCVHGSHRHEEGPARHPHPHHVPGSGQGSPGPAIFQYTTTIGIRENKFRRYVLDRRLETVETDLGPVRRKVSSGYGVKREKYEYEDLARIARQKDISPHPGGSPCKRTSKSEEHLNEIPASFEPQKKLRQHF